MEMTADFRVLVTRVRALALRAITRAGGELSEWQLRWALEPLLADHVVPGTPMPEDVADRHSRSSAASSPAGGKARSSVPSAWE